MMNVMIQKKKDIPIVDLNRIFIKMKYWYNINVDQHDETCLLTKEEDFGEAAKAVNNLRTSGEKRTLFIDRWFEDENGNINKDEMFPTIWIKKCQN